MDRTLVLSPAVIRPSRQTRRRVKSQFRVPGPSVIEEEVAYMGDDLADIPLARRVGLAISVADGAPELKAVCHCITRRGAGHGAAREVVELILKAQCRWDEVVPLALA